MRPVLMCPRVVPSPVALTLDTFRLGWLNQLDKVADQWLGGKNQVIENPQIDQVLTIIES